MKKKNVYLCVTEYHVLLSILLSTEHYATEDYDNLIIICNGGRFKDMSIYETTDIDNISFKKLEEAEFKTFTFIENVYNECTNGVFLFNLNYPHFLYIAYLLYKKGLNTSLVQDGLGLYMCLPYTLREKLSNTRNSYKQLRALRITDFDFYRICFGVKGRYGRAFYGYDATARLSFIKTILLSSPKSAQYAKEKVSTIPQFSALSLSRAVSFFRYKEIADNIKKNDFLFVDQRIEGSFEFVQSLSNFFPQSTIHIKLHPRTPSSWADEFCKNPNVRMIKTMKGIPLDLLIHSLNEVIVITSYSAALLFNNPRCRFYFAYPWYADRGYGEGEFDIKSMYNPTTHIRTIASLEKIELFA